MRLATIYAAIEDLDFKIFASRQNHAQFVRSNGNSGGNNFSSKRIIAIGDKQPVCQRHG
jgi:hypothetical protein